ncbi:hypothetical protein [Vagococcus silagei]|uniref:Uncharacterized protein n=1 Tax=Vagococcus silagei TaxID=2508885 RepID=A0A4S3B515_9ENTE|nr:hypothetical protein [Vagococcus silagei]THB62181.1 hypothetical protein ESZ54_01170 [Vagococcus silagei]
MIISKINKAASLIFSILIGFAIAQTLYFFNYTGAWMFNTFILLVFIAYRELEYFSRNKGW